MHAAEIVCIGNELLSGTTVNTNATFISAKLKENGFSVKRQTSIPDEKDIIVETLSESLACVSLVIATGGLGPTVDDLTRAAVAELMDCSLEYSESLAKELLSRFGKIDSLENQATVPTKALLLPNTSGTAAGLVFIKGSSILIVLPGVPMEMELMLEKEVLPYLKRVFPEVKLPSKERLYFYNLWESTVDPVLRELTERFPKLEMGIYPHHGLLTVALEGNSKEVESAKETLLEHFEDNRYESSDGKIATAVQELFIQNNWTLSLAESCTGGAIAARLTSIPGSSQYFLGSCVVYSNELKEKILNIPHGIIQEHGAVSNETSMALVDAVQQKTSSTFALSATGIAGPTGGSEDKPVGTVFISFKKEKQNPKSATLHIKGERSFIIERTVNFCLGELYRLARTN
jgi:nicotinamide-nucleotide amidase